MAFRSKTLPALGIFFGVSLLFSSRVWSEDRETKPVSVQYVIEDIQGSQVQVLEEGESQWETAVEGHAIDRGDEVKVGKNCEATLMLGDETSAHLGENSDLKVTQIEASAEGGFLSRFQLLAGRVLSDVKKNLLESHSAFEIESNGVVCGVRGTAFEVESSGDDFKVSTHEGEVEVNGGGEAHKITAGNFSSFRKGRFVLLRRLERMEGQRFQKWRAFRQAVREKRLKRLMEIRDHKRQPWVRHHPHLKAELEKHKWKKWRRNRK